MVRYNPIAVLPMPHVTQLPAELLTAVVNELATDTQSLVFCSLTSKMFVRDTRRLLLRNAICRPDPVSLDFAPQASWLGLQSGFGITQVTRRLVLDGRVRDDGGAMVYAHIDMCVLRSLISALPSLEHVAVRNSHWRTCDLEHRHIPNAVPYPNIRIVDIEDVIVGTCIPAADVAAFFRGMVACTTLRIFNVRWNTYEPELHTGDMLRTRFRLFRAPVESLEFHRVLPPDAWRVNGYLVQCRDTLRRLHIGIDTDHPREYGLQSHVQIIYYLPHIV